jgi:hypothetical protein
MADNYASNAEGRQFCGGLLLFSVPDCRVFFGFSLELHHQSCFS